MEMRLVSRLDYAASLCRNRRVLDVGGRIILTETNPPFERTYQKIKQSAKEYKIADILNDKLVDYILDLNTKEGVSRLAMAIESYKPEVILCMETLEHVNYHFEVMNLFAKAVEQYSTQCLITLPNSGNWIVNHIIGIKDHSIAFFRDIAQRFIMRSDLGKFDVKMFPCTGMYLWYWPLVYVLSGFQPTSWGFLIRKSKDIA
jgi:hypothetical protein